MSSAVPHVYVKRIVVESITRSATDKSAELTFDLNFCLKFPATANPLVADGFFSQHELINIFKVLVLEITDAGSDNYLKGLDPQKMASKAWEFKDTDFFNSSRVFTVINPRIAFDSDANTYEVIFETEEKFKVQASNPHLTYMFIPYFESCPKPIFGTPTVERVLDRGQIVEKALKFSTADGKTYSGPVHKHGNKWMAGAKHTSQPHATLKAKEVLNTTIQDLRILSLLANINLDTSYEKPGNSAYFSELSLSTALTGEARYLFNIDFGKMVKHASQYPWLQKNNTLTGKSKIDSIRVLRRRKPKLKAESKLGAPKAAQDQVYAFDENTAQYETIAESADTSPNKLAKGSNVIETHEGEPQEVGNIREISLNSTKSGIRTFSGVDFSIVDATSGKYEYGVEVAISDPSFDHLQQAVTSINNAIAVLEDYYAEAIGFFGKEVSQNFNYLTGRFSQSFIQDTDSQAIQSAIQTYLQALTSMVDVDINVGTYGLKLYSIISPMTGTPENIQRVLAPMKTLQTKLQNLFDDKTKSSQSGGEAGTKNKNTAKIGGSSYTKWFDEEYDASSRALGYEFCRPSTRAFTGPVTIKWADFESATLAQTLSLFTRTTPAKVTEDLTVNPESTQYSFLKPVSVNLDPEKRIDLTPDLDPETHNYIYTAILKFSNSFEPPADKTGFNSNKKNKFNPNKEKLRNELIKFFAGHGVTVGLDGFKTKTEKELQEAYMASVVDERPIKDTLKTLLKDKNKETKQKISEEKSLENDNTNPNNVLINLVQSKDSKPAQKKIDIVNFILGKGDLNLTQSAFNNLPNQIKALLTYYSVDFYDKKGENPPITLKTFSMLGSNPNKYIGFMYHNFFHFMEVQILTGYDKTLNSPIFEKLTKNNLVSGKSLCRLQPTTNYRSIIPTYDLKFPVFNDTFILEVQGVSAESSATPPAKNMKEKTEIENITADASQGSSSTASYDLEITSPADIATGYEYTETKIATAKKKVPNFDKQATQQVFENPSAGNMTPPQGGSGPFGGGY